MWGKILIGIVVVVILFYGLGVFFQGSSTSYVQTRVDQARSEMNEIAEALQKAYRDFDERDLRDDPRFGEFEFGRANRLWPDIFEGYLRVTDPFDPEKGFYLVATWGDDFILISPGPNKYIDIPPHLLEEAMKNESNLEETLSSWTFDIEKGAKSEGDLFLVQKFGS